MKVFWGQDGSPTDQPDIPAEMRVKLVKRDEVPSIALYEVKDGLEYGISVQFDSNEEFERLIQNLDAVKENRVIWDGWLSQA